MNFFLDEDAEDLKNYVKVGSLEQLNQQGRINIRLLGKPISIFYNKNQEHYALEMACKHHGADLSKVEIIEEHVTCPRHGWKYNIKTGACANTNSPSLRIHKVKIISDEVYVSLHCKTNFTTAIFD